MNKGKVVHHGWRYVSHVAPHKALVGKAVVVKGVMAKAAVAAVLLSPAGAYHPWGSTPNQAIPIPQTVVAYGRTPDGFCVVGGAAELANIVVDPTCYPVSTGDGGYRAP